MTSRAELVRWVAGAFLCLLALVVARAHADSPDAGALDVTRLAGGVDVTPSLSVLEDPGALLTFEDVSHARADPRFVKATSEVTFGFTESAFWLRFAAHNPSARMQPWLLELAYAHLDQIDLYTVHADGRVEHVEAGDALPFAARAVDAPNFVFPQEIAAHETVLFYLRARSGGVVRAPLTAWYALDFVSHETRKDIVLWLFYGAVLMMICYNLGVASLLKKREYLLHVGQLVSVVGAIFTLSGQAFQYVLPNTPALANRGVAIFIAMGLLFVQLYSYEIVRAFPQLRSMGRLYRYTLPPTLLALAVTLFSAWGLRVVFMAVALYLPFGAWKLWQVYKVQSRQLNFYLLSFLSLAVSIPVAMAAHAKLIPAYPFFIWAAHIGAAVYAVLTALALPARVNVMSERLATLNVQLSANVDDLQRALARAERATDEARRATKVKDEFMATMSHELRTPLNAIINVPQGLLEDFPLVRSATCSACDQVFTLEPGEQLESQTRCDLCHARGTLHEGTRIGYTGDAEHTARFLRKIERAGQHLLQMVNGVLDFSKMEAGRLELALEPVNLKLLLPDVVDAMTDLAQRREQRIELSLADSSEPCLADATRLRQVLLNLLSNAIKFSETGGSIRVRWEHEAEHDMFSVSDTGIGIAPANHERVFTSFEQVHKGDTRKYGGTGLGLSISRSLVRMHGGELWVESELGAGATFRFRIPRGAQRVRRASTAA